MNKILRIQFLNYFSIVILLSILTLVISGCGFHLRGKDESYKLPFDLVYLECNNVAICPNLETAIKTQHLATLVPMAPLIANLNRPSKNSSNSNSVMDRRLNTNNITTIKLINEQTSRDPQNFNSVGRIAAYILTYQVQAQIWQNNQQVGDNINLSVQSIMQYNDSLILANSLDEAAFWNTLHRMATNQLIRRLIAFRNNPS